MAKKRKKSRIFVVEDHPIMREGVIQILNNEEDFEVCGGAGDVMSALKEIGKTKPDMAIVDISLKNSNGLDLVKSLQKKHKSLPILMLSMYDEVVYAQRALRAGALGYIMKHEKSTKFIEAVRQVLRGEVYVSESIAQKMLQQSIRGKSGKNSSPVEQLSDRELEVFQHLGQGLSNRHIAEKLFLSVKTVESYRDRIKDKLNLKSSSELIQFAIQWEREIQ